MDKVTSSRWKPGQSGNPRGRKPGSGAVQELRREIERFIPEVIHRMAQRALDGDVGAARLLLERAIPPLRPTEAPHGFEFPTGGPAAQARAVIGLGAAGDLTLGQVSLLVSTLTNISRLAETEELERRIAVLEASVEVKTPT
jgi:hypothetical protein